MNWMENLLIVAGGVSLDIFRSNGMSGITGCKNK